MKLLYPRACMRVIFVWTASLTPNIAPAASATDENRASERDAMVHDQLIRRGSGASSSARTDSGLGPPPVVRRWGDEGDRGISNTKVLDAMRSVPRHWFVPAEWQQEAYADRPLPIGYGQTISQPYIVGLMTELLDPKDGWKILEVGTGSGYQAAVLTKFTPGVYTIEIVRPLYEQALARLQRFGLNAEHVLQGDGYFGIEKVAPFDGIIVTAAADHIPPPLLQQLRPGGRMVIPIGPVHATQRLVVVEKDEAGKVRTRSVLPVKFVPLIAGPARAGEKK